MSLWVKRPPMVGRMYFLSNRQASKGECFPHNSIPFQGVDFSSPVKTGFKNYNSWGSGLLQRSKLDELVKSLILPDVPHKRLFTKPSTLRG